MPTFADRSFGRAKIVRTLVAIAVALGSALCFGARPYQPVRGDPLLEPWRWRAFPELSGLGAQCMAERADGTMLFGSAEGVWSYNGFEWILHSTAEIKGGSVLAICTHRDGSVYAAGRWGISHFKDGTWNKAFPATNARFAEIRKILRGSDGSLWAATAWGALRHHQSTWTLYTDPATATRLRLDPNFQALRIELLPEAVLAEVRRGALPANRSDIAEIAEDRQGRIWLGTAGGELLSYAPMPVPTGTVPAGGQERWTLHNESDGMVCGTGPSILALRDGAIWVVYGGASGHANVLDGGVWRTMRLADAGVPGDIGQLIQTRDGVVWLSSRYVVSAYRDGQWRNYEKPEVPVPSARNYILETSDGALWLAGPSTEIQRVDYGTSRWLTLRDLNFHWESPAGAQWFLHRDGRVVRNENDQWTSFGAEDGLIDAPVALVGARNGDVWVAGSHAHTAATARFDGRQWSRLIHDTLSWGVDWRAAFASSDGSVWFGAAVDSSNPPHQIAGLMQFHDGKWTHHHQPYRNGPKAAGQNPAELLPATQRPEPVGKFLLLGESRDGKIWAGRNLLINQTGGKWSVFSPPPDIRLGVIEAMLTTRERELWIGSRQFGALRYDGHGWRRFQGKDKLVANTVRALTETADGSIWAATDRGVSRFDGRTWTADLLPDALNIPNESCGLKASPSGALWINRATLDWNRRAWPKAPSSDPAVGEFWTVSHRFDGTPPETVITVGAEEVAPSGNLSVLWRGAAAWREDKDAQLQYSFRLDREPWSAFTSEAGHAFFTLPGGPHRFEVRARNRDFVVDPTPATLDFVVLPPVWRQPWFVLLLAVLTGSVAVQSARVFLERSRLRKTNSELAGEIKTREQTEAALRDVLRHARTIVMQGTVTAPEGWTAHGPEWSARDFHWEGRFQDEAAAREVLPLDVLPGEDYHHAWERAKHRDDWESMAAVATRALATGAASWQQEFRCIDRHGNLHWLTQSASIESAGHGHWRITTINTDITARVLAEEALRTSEERLSTVFHLSPTPICVVRAADNRFVDVNEAFVRDTGYTREEFLGRTPADLNLWADPKERVAIMREVHEKGAAIACKLRGRRKSGEIGFGLSSVTRIALNGEEHFLWLILDITEREHAEEARRESDRRFRQVTENIDEVFWLTDVAKQEMIYVSPAYRRIWGRDCESLFTHPQSWLEAVHPDDRARVRTAALTQQAVGKYDVEYRIVRPDGVVRWVHDRAFPIGDAGGHVYRIAGVAADITGRRLLEEQLRQAQKMESLGTLAGGIAHDFNNILTGVFGSAEIVRLNLPAVHPALPWVGNIIAAGGRARELVQQILTFGRKHESKFAPQKIQQEVDEALRLLRSTIPTTVKIESHLDPACPFVMADKTQIHQVAMNLCTNAWHALPESGGLIEVTLAPVDVTPAMAATRAGLVPGAHVLLTVRDNGSGIPPAVLPRIFEPFFTTKEQGRGTGLGLAVVHGIVASHRGGIFVRSAPNEGTRFEVFLPAIVAPPPVSVTSGDAPIVLGRQERILVVDDDAISLAALRGQLEHIGYRVVAMSDATVALKLFLTKPSGFDLVLTDYAMPGLSGEELSAKMLAARPDCPILLASGFVAPEHIQSALAQGVRAFVRKPVTLPELSQVIARHLRREPPK